MYLLYMVQDTTTNPIYTGESTGLSLEDERMQARASVVCRARCLCCCLSQASVDPTARPDPWSLAAPAHRRRSTLLLCNWQWWAGCLACVPGCRLLTWPPCLPASFLQKLMARYGGFLQEGQDEQAATGGGAPQAKAAPAAAAGKKGKKK